MPVTNLPQGDGAYYESPDISLGLTTDIQPNWASSNLGFLAANACIISDVLPTNVGCFFLAELASHNYPLAMASFVGSTLLTKMSGTIAAVDMMHTDRGMKLADYADKRLQKLGALKNFNTNTPIDLAIGVTAGTSVMSLVRHYQREESGRSSERRYGLMVALGSTIMLSVQFGFIAESVTNPDSLTVPFGLIAAGSFLGMWRWIKKRSRRGAADQLESESLEREVS